MIRLFLLCLSFCLGLSSAAVAQNRWQSFSDATVRAGAGICPLRDAQTGQFLCLSLSCTPDGPREWVISYNGGTPPSGPVRGSWSIDGTAMGQMDFTDQQEPGYTKLVAPWNEEQDSFLTSKMSSGFAAQVALAAPNWQASYAFALGGAAAPLQNVLGICPAPPPPPIADPAALARAEVTQFCAEMGGRMEEQPGFAERPDLNGDGRADLALDWGALPCSTAGVAFCGSAGCVTGLYLALPEGGYREVLHENIRGFETGVFPVLTLHLHGNACGKTGVERCVKYYRIDEAGGLVALD